MATREEIGNIIMELRMNDCLITPNSVLNTLKEYDYEITNDTIELIKNIIIEDFGNPNKLVDSYFVFDNKIVKELGIFKIPLQYYIAKINKNKDEYCEVDFEEIDLEFIPVDKEIFTKKHMSVYCILN